MHEQHNNLQNESMIELSADAFVSLVVQEFKARQLAALPTLAQMNVEFVPSEPFGQSIAQQQCKFNKAQNRGKRLRSLRRTLLVAAVTIAIISCLMLPVAAVRKAIVQTVMQWKDGFTEINFITDEVANEPLDVTIGYMPEGYVPDEPFDLGEYYQLIAYAEDGSVIAIEITKITDGNGPDVDNEHTSYYTIVFDDTEALWMPHEQGSSVFLWTSNGYYIAILSSLELTEILKIAQFITL